ncbi:MAG: aldolase catalytic domain-containing protein [Clostridia bacterium]|nr:aldolase catalytic domain-containing protein [Clostridia bacterium]
MNSEKKNSFLSKKGSLLSYRPDIKVLDCTIRDGGLMNSFRFEDDFVRAVYDTNVEAGVDYMEFGYKASRKYFNESEFGPWKFSDESAIRRIVGENKTSLKISVMADAGRTDYTKDILPKEESVIDMIRIATYIHQLPEAIEMIKDAHNKGYETTVNLMAISMVKEHELDEALQMLTSTQVDVIYLVDSFGSLYSESIQELIAKYLSYADATGKKIGIHAHNNQQLAYANTIEALIYGASYLDATIGGLGRGAGNCNMELLLGFLKNPKYHLRPILKCIEENIIPIKQKITWGFDIPYMISGQLNQHPKDAIKFSTGEGNTQYVKFYDMSIDNV